MNNPTRIPHSSTDISEQPGKCEKRFFTNSHLPEQYCLVYSHPRHPGATRWFTCKPVASNQPRVELFLCARTFVPYNPKFSGCVLFLCIVLTHCQSFVCFLCVCLPWNMITHQRHNISLSPFSGYVVCVKCQVKFDNVSAAIILSGLCLGKGLQMALFVKQLHQREKLQKLKAKNKKCRLLHQVCRSEESGCQGRVLFAALGFFFCGMVSPGHKKCT